MAAFLYLVFFHLQSQNGVWLVVRGNGRNLSRCRTRRIFFGGLGTGAWRRRIWWIARRETQLIRAAFFFSLASAFNIGYQEFNIGLWLKQLTMRDYELKPRGIVRTIAGIQAVASVYLLALWLLCYFGHPFA